MLVLTDSEISELTRRIQPAAQARALAEARIPYRMIAGRPVVSRAALHDILAPASASAGPRLRLEGLTNAQRR